MNKRVKKNRDFITSFKDCLNGLSFVVVNEDNFKREIILGILALLFCVILKVSKIEFIIVLIMIALVLVSEIINTAIERAVDLCTLEYKELARISKDVSAGAVLTMCFFASVVGIIIFIPRIINLLGGR